VYKRQNQLIVVKLDLRRDIQIPKLAKAVILPDGFMGGKKVELVYERPCAGADCAVSGDYLRGETKGMLEAMLGEGGINGYISAVKTGLSDIIDTLNRQLLSEEAKGPLAESLRDLRGSLASLKNATARLDEVMARSSNNISTTFENLQLLTGMLSGERAKIQAIIDNADAFSADMRKVDLSGTIEEAQTVLTQLKRTLNAADTAAAQVGAVLEQISEGEGSLGKLLHDDELYQMIARFTLNADSLTTDLLERPYRYVPLKSRRRVKRFDRLDAKEALQQQAPSPSGD
jgi:phospholipid/cholesterol/gamma-HCH transport system substrate-binding protein